MPPIIALVVWAFCIGNADDLLSSQRQERAEVIYDTLGCHVQDQAL